MAAGQNRPMVTALSWGDSRLPNVIYRGYTPVGLLEGSGVTGRPAG